MVYFDPETARDFVDCGRYLGVQFDEWARFALQCFSFVQCKTQDAMVSEFYEGIIAATPASTGYHTPWWVWPKILTSTVVENIANLA